MKKYDRIARGKDRLTISLPLDLLTSLDNAIDGKEIRNRSHAIEHFLRKSLKPSVTNAVILAGSPMQTKTPPCLTTIDGRNLLDITLEHIAAARFRNVYMLAGSSTGTLKASVGRHSHGLTVHWIPETEPMGTGGALKLLESTITEPFLILHGDILTNIPIQPFIDFHMYEQTMVTIAVKPRHSEPKYGQVTLQGNRITTFTRHDRGTGISVINTGVYMVNPALFSYLPKGKPSTVEADVFPRLAVENQLSAFFFQGMWFDINSHTNMRDVVRRYHLERR